MMDRERLAAGDTTARLWREAGVSGSPERREQFLRDCRRGAKAGLCGALYESARRMPEKPLWEVYEELVPGLLDYFAQLARESGLNEEETALFVGAYREGFEAVAKQFGFSAT